jgi:hypothetical protein
MFFLRSIPVLKPTLVAALFESHEMAWLAWRSRGAGNISGNMEMQVEINLK